MYQDAIINATTKLPPFPQVALKAVKLLRDPDYSAAELVNVVQYDPNITAAILRFANSAAFGVPNRVRSLHQAVTLLGARHIVDLLFLTGALTYFEGTLEGYGTRGSDLLFHSVTVAILSRTLAEKMALQDTATIFTAGLLHDIGKIVLNTFVYDTKEAILTRVVDQGLSFVEAERDVLGIDHAQVGADLARKWGLPEEIHTPIGLHHQSDSAPAQDPITQLIFLADQICFLVSKAAGADRLSFEKLDKARSRCKLQGADLDAALASTEQSIESFRKLLSPADASPSKSPS